MKCLIIISLLFLGLNTSFSQFSVRLIDNHSSKTIVSDSTLSIHNANYEIDSNTNEIVFSRLKGKNLTISMRYYEEFNEKINKSDYKGKVLPIRLNPTRELIQERYDDLWVNKSKSEDILNVHSPSQIKDELLYFVNQLFFFRGCAEAVCNFSRTYKYTITLEKMEHGLYEITSLKDEKHFHSCKEFQAKLLTLPQVFPKLACSECGE